MESGNDDEEPMEKPPWRPPFPPQPLENFSETVRIPQEFFGYRQHPQIGFFDGFSSYRPEDIFIPDYEPIEDIAEPHREAAHAQIYEPQYDDISESDRETVDAQIFEPQYDDISESDREAVSDPERDTVSELDREVIYVPHGEAIFEPDIDREDAEEGISELDREDAEEGISELDREAIFESARDREGVEEEISEPDREAAEQETSELDVQAVEEVISEPEVPLEDIPEPVRKAREDELQVMTDILLNQFGIEEIEDGLEEEAFQYVAGYVHSLLEESAIYAMHANKKAIDERDIALALENLRFECLASPAAKEVRESLYGEAERRPFLKRSASANPTFDPLKEPPEEPKETSTENTDPDMIYPEDEEMILPDSGTSELFAIDIDLTMD